MFCSPKQLVTCFIPILLLAACNKPPELGHRRVAIIPFENLTPDPAYDWLSRAVSNVLASQIRSERLTPVEIGAVRDAATGNATEIVQGYFERVHDKLRITATVQDLARRKTLHTEIAEGQADAGVLPLIDAIARKLTGQVQGYASRSEEAVRLFFEAVNEKESGRLKRLERAVELDPAFGPAWLLRAQTLLALKDASAAKLVLDQAGQNSKNFREIDRARLDLLRADDPAKRAAAMEQVARASEDIDVWRQLAEFQMLRKQHAGAIKAYEEAVKLDPENAAMWNQLGYSHAFNHDLPGAIKALEQYRRIAPADANAIDSLGEVHFMAGKFAEAERYFLEAHAKDAAIVNGGEPFRAALARGLAGDKAGARKLFEKYLAARSQDQFGPLREALFLFMIGESTTAEEKLNKLAEGSAAARAQLAIWHLSRHDLAKGRELARSAARDAKTPPERTLTALALATASDAVPNLPRNIEAFRLLFHKSPEAEALCKQIYDATPSTSASEARVMLMWAMQINGKSSAELTKGFPPPPQHPDPGLGFLTIPKYVELTKR